MSALLKIPQLLQGGYGILIRIGLVALLALGVWCWGATWGYQHEERKLDVLNAQVKAIGDQALARNVELKVKYEANRKSVENDYEDQLAFIATWHDAHPRIVVRPNPGGGAAAAVAPGAESPHGAAGEPVAPGGDRARDEGDTVAVTADFVAACAIDAAHVNAFRAYVTTNGLPVE